MKRSEQQIQATVMQHLWRRSSPNTFAFHVPNGGWRSPIEAKILKGQGVVSGTPDIFIVSNGKPYALEIKTETGRISPVQRTAHVLLEDAGVEVATAYGLDQAIAQIEEWGVVRGRAA